MLFISTYHLASFYASHYLELYAVNINPMQQAVCQMLDILIGPQTLSTLRSQFAAIREPCPLCMMCMKKLRNEKCSLHKLKSKLARPQLPFESLHSLCLLVADCNNSLQTHSKQLLLFSLRLTSTLHALCGILVFRISYFLSGSSLQKWFIIPVQFNHAIKPISAQGGWTHLGRVIKVIRVALLIIKRRLI